MDVDRHGHHSDAIRFRHFPKRDFGRAVRGAEMTRVGKGGELEPWEGRVVNYALIRFHRKQPSRVPNRVCHGDRMGVKAIEIGMEVHIGKAKAAVRSGDRRGGIHGFVFVDLGREDS